MTGPYPAAALGQAVRFEPRPAQLPVDDPVDRDDPAHPDAVYRERTRLVAYLAGQHPAHWAEPDPSDPHRALPVVCVHTPAGQMTWHVHLDDVGLLPAELEVRASDYDGHSTATKYTRLATLAAAGGGRCG